MLLRLAYLGVTNAFALLRLLPMSDRDKDVEILALRHQITVLERQLGKTRPCFSTSDRAFLAALLHRRPIDALHRLRLLVLPETVLRWHRDLLAHRHAAQSRPKHPGRPRTVRSIRLPVLRLAQENPTWGYRRIHGELLVLGIDVAASTVWQILKDAGIGPTAGRTTTTWSAFLRSQADALLACDFFETCTLSGTRLYVLAVIEHASRRIRVLGATAHPTASWVTQAARNLVMDLEDAGSAARFLIRDRDGKFPALFDTVLAAAGIQVVHSRVRIPRMNAIMERWIRSCRRELLDRTLIWNQQHLLHALREYEQFYNTRRPHQGIANARPLHALPQPATDQAALTYNKSLPRSEISVGDRTRDRGHGRRETRTVKVVTPHTPGGIAFPHAEQAIRITRSRTTSAKTTRETVYFTVSLPAGDALPAELQDWIRREWLIENQVHHVRDVTFHETHTKPAPAPAPPSSRPCATPRSAGTAPTATPTSPEPSDAPTADHTT